MAVLEWPEGQAFQSFPHREETNAWFWRKCGSACTHGNSASARQLCSVYVAGQNVKGRVKNDL